MKNLMNDEVPPALVARGEDLVAEGMSLAERFGRWVEEVFALERTISDTSGADSDTLTVDESDALGALWSSLCRTPELHDVAEWIERHAHRVNHGRPAGEVAHPGELADLIGWTLGGHR